MSISTIVPLPRRCTRAGRVALAGLLRRDPSGDRERVATLLGAAEAVYGAGPGQQAIAAIRAAP